MIRSLLQFVAFQDSDIDSPAVDLVHAICTCRSGARFSALVSLRLREHISSLVASAPVLSCLPVSISSLLQFVAFSGVRYRLASRSSCSWLAFHWILPAHRSRAHVFADAQGLHFKVSCIFSVLTFSNLAGSSLWPSLPVPVFGRLSRCLSSGSGRCG